MKEPELHEIEFEDDNHYNLYLFCRHLQLKINNPEHYSVEKLEYEDCYKVSIGDQLFYIENKELGKFWLDLDKGTAEAYYPWKKKVRSDEIYSAMWNPKVDLSEVDLTVDESDEFYSLVGVSFLNVEDRVRSLMTATTHTITEIAGILNKEMADVGLNTDIPKDFDAIMTFTTELGRKFNIQLCLDKVLPVDPNNSNLEIPRTPITEEDLKQYLPTAGNKVISRLEYINGLVKAVFESKRIAESKELTQYAEKLINGVLIPPFLDQNVTFFQFGGRDDWSSLGPDTPNNVACFKYLDEEAEKIIKLLGDIPLQEGVEVWSLDIDTFAIFGRKDNKVVTPALQGYTQDLLKNYSQGFERVLTIRLTMLDTPHIFKG